MKTIFSICLGLLCFYTKAQTLLQVPDTLIGPQGITQGGVSYITTNYGKALGFDSGKFVSTLEGIRFAISEYSKEQIEDVDKYHLKEIERFFSNTVIATFFNKGNL